MPDKTPEQLRKFADWVEKWWQNFAKMQPGTAYQCDKCAKNVELFIEIAKDYIDRSPLGYQYEFSSDYKYFKRFTNTIL